MQITVRASSPCQLFCRSHERCIKGDSPPPPSLCSPWKHFTIYPYTVSLSGCRLSHFISLFSSFHSSFILSPLLLDFLGSVRSICSSLSSSVIFFLSYLSFFSPSSLPYFLSLLSDYSFCCFFHPSPVAVSDVGLNQAATPTHATCTCLVCVGKVPFRWPQRCWRG